MKISRFFGATSRDVLKQVRDALGPDALIVSNRSIDGGVEVLATAELPFGDDDDDDFSPVPATKSEATDASPTNSAFRPAGSSFYGLPEPSVNPYAGAPVTPRTPPPRATDSAPPPPPASRFAAGYGVDTSLDMRFPGPTGRETSPPASQPPAYRETMRNEPDVVVSLSDTSYRAPSPQPSMAKVSKTTEDSVAAGLREEINALRGALESRMDGLIWGGRQGSASEPVGGALFRALLEAGFSMPLVRALVERLPQNLNNESAMAWARNELVTHLPVLRTEEDLFSSGGVFALVGPTGVGKTTTLAKLAARCVAREGREQVAMLTTDNFRIGALEQLQIYGRLMGVPAKSVRDVSELRKMLAELRGRKIILIDTTGISQRDRNVADQVAMLCGAGQPVRRLLVLNAASQGDTLDEVAHAYRHGGGEDVIGCIITKLDEASRLGAVLDTAIRHRLPIHYVSQGQKVPENLEIARADVLVDQALATLRRGKALYAPSEADFASLCATSRGDEALDAERRRQWLASAIMRSGGSATELEAALEWLDSDLACSQARSLWRDYMGNPSKVTLASLSETPMSVVRRSFSSVCDRTALVMHGKAALKGTGLPGGTLLASMVLSDRADALAVPAQNLVLPHGIVSSFEGAAGIANVGEALDARVTWLDEHLASVPLVHMIESGTIALWQSLTERGVSWVARTPAALRIAQDECPTTLGAVAKSVGYAPVGRPGDQPGLFRSAAHADVPLALWASGTEVALIGRAGALTPVRLVCARLVDPRTNQMVSQLFGLTNLSSSQADAATVARWLVLQEQAKMGVRYIAHAWQALPALEGQHALMRHGLMAGQLAAACWQLAYASDAAVMNGPLTSVMGPQRRLSGRLLPVALLKLFAMLEMAG